MESSKNEAGACTRMRPPPPQEVAASAAAAAATVSCSSSVDPTGDSSNLAALAAATAAAAAAAVAAAAAAASEPQPPILTASVPPSSSSSSSSSAMAVAAAAGSGGSSRKRGRGRPPSCTPTPAAEARVSSYVSTKDGTEYSVNDCVYLEVSKPTEPYRIGRVKEFVVSKRDSLLVSVSLFYRLSEIPEQVYLRLLQDRSSELPSEIVDVIVNVRARELFQSEKLDSYRVSALRGKCTVVPFQDVYSARSFLPLPDAFFTTLHYNPDTRRLATIQGEIRIGASHQARLPECRPDVTPEDRDDTAETLLWRPGRVCDGDVIMYLRAARSVAAFAGMCDGGGSASEGARSACRDDTTQSAMDTLHTAGYNREAALVALVKSPLPQSVDRRWSDEDSKKFMKGLRIYGKNFFKIRKELLPHKETCNLVEYYYYWKKLPVAFGSRPNARRRAGFLRRQSVRPATSEEGSSSVSDESEFDGNGEISCFKCEVMIPPSKVWHQVDDRGYLCEECSERYKKYGGRDEGSDCDGTVGGLPDYVFRPVQPSGVLPPPLQSIEHKVIVAPTSTSSRTKDSISTAAAAAAPDESAPPTPDRELSGDSAPNSAASSSSASSFASKSPPPLKKRRTSAAGCPVSEAPLVGRTSPSAGSKASAGPPLASTGPPFVPSLGMSAPCLLPAAAAAAVVGGGGSTALPTPGSKAAAGRSESGDAVPVPGGGPARGFMPGSIISSVLPPLIPATAAGEPATSDEADGDSDDGRDVRLASLIKIEPGLRGGGSVSPPPAVIEHQCHVSTNAVFYRVLGRRSNSCARSDIVFKPPPDHSLAKAREQRARATEVRVKEERREERASERAREHGLPDGLAAASSSSSVAAVASSSRSYRPSSAAASGHCSTSAAAAAERSMAGTPRLYAMDPAMAPYYPLGSGGGGGGASSMTSSLTPALMHLGHLARPHGSGLGAADDYTRHLAAIQSIEAMMQHQQQQQRLFGSGMYQLPHEMRPSSVAPMAGGGGGLPPDFRERVEAAWKSQQEPITREQYEMHIRDKQNAATMAAAGMNPFDPLLREQLQQQLHQFRLATAAGALPPGMSPHAPLTALSNYYQSHMAAAAAAAAAAASSGDPTRGDRLSRLGYPSQTMPVPPSSDSPLGGISDRLPFPPPPAHLSHTHTHTHLHVHQPPSELAAAAAPFLPPHLLSGGGGGNPGGGGPLGPGGIDPLAAALMGMGAGTAGQPMGAAAGGGGGSLGLPSHYMMPSAAAAAAAYQQTAATAALFGLPAPSHATMGGGGRDYPFDYYFGRQFEPQQMQLPPHIQQELQRQMFDRDRQLAAAMAEASRH